MSKPFQFHFFERRNMPAWVTLVVGVLLTLTVWQSLRNQSVAYSRQQFDVHVRDVINAIQERLHDSGHILNGGLALFDASDFVSRSEWHLFINRLNIKESYPGIQGVGYSVLINPSYLKAHVAAMRKEGFKSYMIRPPGDRPLYTSIIYLEPFVGRNLAAFGYDMMSETTRAEAMRSAVDNDRIMLSGKVKLVQETHGKAQAGFLMYAPQYYKGRKLTTAAERWDALQGFVYSAYRVDDLMAGVLGVRDLAVNFSIFDGEGESQEARLFSSSEDETPYHPALSVRRNIDAFGHKWTVRLNSLPAFKLNPHSLRDTAILGLGIGISLLLFVSMSLMIFQRKRAEELAEKMTGEMRNTVARMGLSEARTQAILDNVLDGIITIDEFGIVESFNQSAEKIFAYRSSEVIGKNVKMLMPEPYHDQHDGYLHNFTTTGVKKIIGSGHQVAGLRKDGSTFSMDLAVSEMRFGNNSLFTGIVRDITERKNVERLQGQFSAIIESSIDAIMSKDLNGIVTSWNPAAEKLFGYSEQEMIGQAMLRIVPADRAEEEPQILAKIRRGEHIEHFETIRRKKNGEEIPISVTISPISDAAGKIIGASKIARDISERNQAIQARRDDEARMSAILDNILDGIITIGDRGTVESFNQSAEHIFGYIAAEVIGNNVKMLMPEPYHEEHDDYLHNFMSTGIRKIIGSGRQVVGKRKDGTTFPMDLAVSEMELGGKRMFTGIVRDITERVRVERMKSEFISTVSHELRTPLTSIRGSLALVVGGVVGELPVAAKPMLDIAHKNCERLILLVNDILDMEKIEAGKMEFDLQEVKLMPLLKQALDGNRAYAEQFKVSYELESELPEVIVRLDANRLMQVFANLLSNAAKFSPAGGNVSIAVERKGTHIRVAVKDQGSGIPDDFKDKIFQKFAQADSSDTRKKGGTGLGLSITKAIVEQMGGKIDFESQPNVLTTFYFEFPEWHEQKQFVEAHHGPRSEKTALVCEDDKDTSMLLRMLLEHVGFTVDVANDTAQAKQFLTQGAYQVMMLDLALPTQIGMSLLRELRADTSTADLPVVVVSAKALEVMQEPGSQELGIIDWIAKPINREQLMAAISRAAEQFDGGRARVLYIEDDADVFEVVKGIAVHVAVLEQAASLSEARRRLASQVYDLVILDLALPDGSGLELLPLLKKCKFKVPILVFSINEMKQEDAQKVDAVLVKSRTNNEELLETIKRLIG